MNTKSLPGQTITQNAVRRINGAHLHGCASFGNTRQVAAYSILNRRPAMNAYAEDKERVYKVLLENATQYRIRKQRETDMREAHRPMRIFLWVISAMAIVLALGMMVAVQRDDSIALVRSTEREG